MIRLLSKNLVCSTRFRKIPCGVDVAPRRGFAEHRILTPTFPDSVRGAEVANVKFQTGERVAMDDLVMVLETFKFPLEIYSPIAGVLKEVHASIGAKVVTDDPLFTVDDEGLAEAARLANPAHPTEAPVSKCLSTRTYLSSSRAAIAANLLLARQNCALLTTFNELDTTAVARFRKERQVRFGSIFAAAVGRALQRHPYLNASIVDDDTPRHRDVVILHKESNVGMAVAGPRGLVVPTLLNCHSKSLAEIDEDMRRVVTAATKGERLPYQDRRPATFTISNGGAFGSLMGTPILSPPQVAILGMHGIKNRPVVDVEGAIVSRPMMYLALTYDHRLLDGKDSVLFLKDLITTLESPAGLQALLHPSSVEP